MGSYNTRVRTSLVAQKPVAVSQEVLNIGVVTVELHSLQDLP